MLQLRELVGTPWINGALRARPGHLVFGQTYEDPEIELSAIAPKSCVFCIAGAGYTAQALAAAGHQVTAVDVSAAQVEYARSRVGGGVARAGLAERLLGFGRNLAVLCGWSKDKLERFVNLSHCDEQVAYWDRELDTPGWRAMFDALLAPRLLQVGYRGPFVASLPANFGARLRGRLRRGWALHSNRANPYAELLLLGNQVEPVGVPKTPIRWVCADAAEFLERCAARSFDAFALSNIGDGVAEEYRQRLSAAVEHAAADGAVVIERSFREPDSAMVANLAAMDRSLLWGLVSVRRVDALRIGGERCCIG
jgi:S-adenosylmethionine:diacylglycerol 3-amino-3-carboxypropyl transferase